MLERSAEKSLADLYRDLPVGFTSPTMSPHCEDEVKYDVVDRLISSITSIFEQRKPVNGIRFAFDSGSWGLIRASSNKPELVVVCKSMQSTGEMREIFSFIHGLSGSEPSVGAFNQTI